MRPRIIDLNLQKVFIWTGEIIETDKNDVLPFQVVVVAADLEGARRMAKELQLHISVLDRIQKTNPQDVFAVPFAMVRQTLIIDGIRKTFNVCNGRRVS